VRRSVERNSTLGSRLVKEAQLDSRRVSGEDRNGDPAFDGMYAEAEGI
jgi:hypothetical protein